MLDLEDTLNEVKARVNALNSIKPDSLVLTDREEALVRLRDEFYGSWSALIADLKSRKDKRPYVHNIFVNCSADAILAKGLSAYESRNEINLSDLTRTN